MMMIADSRVREERLSSSMVTMTRRRRSKRTRRRICPRNASHRLVSLSPQSLYSSLHNNRRENLVAHPQVRET